MLKTILFPFRLLYYFVLILVRMVRFFFGAGLRTLRVTGGGLFVLVVGVVIGALMGRKYKDAILSILKSDGDIPKTGRGKRS